MLEPLVPVGHPHHDELASLRTKLERCWCAETSFWPGDWSQGMPSLGQCAVTALAVHAQFGGQILRSTNEGVMHYWNRLDGIEVDLSRDQFAVWDPEEPVAVVDAATVASSGPTLAARSQLLANLLDADQASGASPPLPPD